jgi:predicted ATPase
MGDSAPEIAKLMPELRRIFPDIPPPAGLAPEQQRRFLFNACREFLERSARFQPIVAVFEDLHWADEPALLLLRHLAQTVAAVPLLIIGTYRDVDLDVSRPFAGALESWIRENSATRLALHRLDPSGVQAMLSALSGNTPPPSLVSAIFEQTEGNPFFVLEVFHHLAEQGKLLDQQNPCDLALQTGALQVPESVRLVIGRWLAKLRQETKRVLTTASCDWTVLQPPAA